MHHLLMWHVAVGKHNLVDLPAAAQLLEVSLVVYRDAFWIAGACERGGD